MGLPRLPAERKCVSATAARLIAPLATLVKLLSSEDRTIVGLMNDGGLRSPAEPQRCSWGLWLQSQQLATCSKHAFF